MIASRALVVGLGVTGEAMARALLAHGGDVIVADDHPTDVQRRRAELLGVDVIERPSVEQWRALVAGRDAVLPAPGLAEDHPVFDAAAAHDVPILSEFDLAREWDARPILAITGTNGKTTVTTMVKEMMDASGIASAAVGNTDVPLVAALDDPDIEVFVVEASSFRLGHTQRFLPTAATWLNFAPDHLDAHASLQAYEAAKARIWADLDEDHGQAIANADDPVVMRNRNRRARTTTFGLGGAGKADSYVDGDRLITASGDELARVDELFRSLPHDLSNALAASATALAGGATLEGARRALLAFQGLAHRVELVATVDDIAWYDDSKATAPHATLAAVRGFRSVVLLAGGRNKGLDLGALADGIGHLRAVVAFGEAGPAVADVFHGRVPVEIAAFEQGSLADAVDRAARLAHPGDVVLLSPGCASFDAFESYKERGEVFAADVRRRLGLPTVDADQGPS